VTSVLYLDYDAVLHPEAVYWRRRRGVYLDAAWTEAGHRLFEHAELLEVLMEPYPKLTIVLSTLWVVQYGRQRAAKRLPPRLQRRVVGDMSLLNGQLRVSGNVTRQPSPRRRRSAPTNGVARA
jgi:hypothetical protein